MTESVDNKTDIPASLGRNLVDRRRQGLKPADKQVLTTNGNSIFRFY